MKGTKTDLIKYRMLRARDTFEDAQILAEKTGGIPRSTDSIMPPIIQLWQSC